MSSVGRRHNLSGLCHVTVSCSQKSGVSFYLLLNVQMSHFVCLLCTSTLHFMRVMYRLLALLISHVQVSLDICSKDHHHCDSMPITCQSVCIQIHVCVCKHLTIYAYTCVCLYATVIGCDILL